MSNIGREINAALGAGYGRNLWDYEVRYREESESLWLVCTSCDDVICEIEDTDSLYALVATALDHRPGHDCEEDL
ncbi:hypothetical protein GCM10028801_31290 [Nocardioides maradonensis]